MDENKVTWQEILGGLGAGLNSVFGGHPGNYPQGGYPGPAYTNPNQIMGMDKTTFYLMAVVGLIILALVVYMMMKK